MSKEETFSKVSKSHYVTVFGNGRVTKPQCAYMKVCVEACPLFVQTKQDNEQFLCAGGGQVQCV